MKKETAKIGLLDLAQMLPKLIEKEYVTKDCCTSPRFCGLDEEFKSWFPQYSEEQFKQIEAVLEQSYSDKFKKKKKMSDPQFKELFEHDEKMADGLSRLINFGVQANISKKADKNKYLHD